MWKLYQRKLWVLILVLMEYAHWVTATPTRTQVTSSLNPCSNGICSLRLVVKQKDRRSSLRLNPCSNGICSLSSGWTSSRRNNCSLNPCSNGICSLRCLRSTSRSLRISVLILVLMEYAHWDCIWRIYAWHNDGLNPCSNGICSLSSWPECLGTFHYGLNPCSNGICSLRDYEVRISRKRYVLILVLMEYAHWDLAKYSNSHFNLQVLILVLMEYALWVLKDWRTTVANCLVLILIVAEYALWVLQEMITSSYPSGLNPYCSGICSMSSLTMYTYSRWTFGLNPYCSGICSMSQKKQTSYYKRVTNT